MVLKVDNPTGLTCPEESVTNYTITSAKTDSGSSYLGVSKFKYGLDEGDYNNSVITINTAVKVTSDKTTGYCDFKSTVFSSVTIWNNIKLIGNITVNHNSGHTSVYAGFVIKSNSEST